MSPKETTVLLSEAIAPVAKSSSLSSAEDEALLASGFTESEIVQARKRKNHCRLCALASAAAGLVLIAAGIRKLQQNVLPSGDYKLVECQEGGNFFKYYSFYDGPDSLGSAGYNTYVSKKRAFELGIANTTKDPETGKEHVYMMSMKTEKGPRESIRLEGNRRYNHGLFILDLDHMPNGCGVWPAFWMTDEAHWPSNGEIDIVEGINHQPMVKTALHTSGFCDMYAHVPSYAWSGKWDTATGLFDTFTGEPNYVNRVQADNCWVMAPHQWANQGCVAVDKRNNTLGAPLNKAGGGVYVLEWDPVNLRIRSWAFPRSEGIPDNLQGAMDTASFPSSERIVPDTDEWGLPFSYFAVGPTTGCSADHFKNMRLVINLAFCGTVSGNRFLKDCPEVAAMDLVDEKHKDDPWETCNAYIESNPKALEEAYWKIRGAYVYQRS